MLNLFSKQSPWGWRIAAIGSVLFISAMFAACGDEVSKVTEVSQAAGVQVVDAGKALPSCTADNEGVMVYSVDSAATYTCIGTTWTSMKGKDGKDGADGKNGKDGKNGANGAAGAAGSAGADGDDGSSCTVKALKNGNGYKIVCGGDSVGVVLNGQNGAKGDSGVKGDSGATGNNGLSAYEIAKAGGYEGSEEEWIASLKGDTGAKGDSGVAGTSCTAEEVSDGVKITCPDGNSFTLRNGTDGKDGNDGYIDGWILDYRDKHLYRTVTIGDQTWMAENLNYEVETGSYCYNDSAKYCEKYGRLYTWTVAVGKSEDECGYDKTCGLSGKVRGVCPEGWHLPDTTEWNKLFTAVGGDSTAGKKLKSQSGWSWNDDDGTSGNGTDAYGFSAFPAGSNFDAWGDGTSFWSATERNSYVAYGMGLFYETEYAYLVYCDKDVAFSVRCLKD
ncbi:fibrobacter succinogenes major paralogous domain-containing protein [uncultured Fibrobacter sp.]|uniref:fibrobacter succinogenes major paralogous domain-containing protein n=1 Tax=uncultured Fibrobacter sp. TaxID=261512 RepID=UPI00261F7C1A|nr:fibrobacter succinogenes major paralogous domain-containing protein [uncultured Fibrobacter sp.]